ncbi:hypothetical protein EHS25_001705 [Saitozyma podzolica]|uniref:Major facilitator superfamily (MFS) profile domain-containing protein n=1 Tax=Saitozyma podzolica TaxID=1890683 RepID=A0A427YF77_9TREE|nr:hypothetical protein EHS25_001705 [Saitozyma podzolica]
MSVGTSAVHTPTSPGVDEKHLSSVTFEGDSEHEVGIDLYRRAAKVEWIPEENRKVLRKIDLWILPAFCITQGLAYLDKTALNYGNLFGMRTGLNVTTAQFSWFASVFYIGYLVATWPVSILLQKYSTGKVMGVVVFFWGIVCATTAACHNFAGGLVNRVILGFLEAAVTPGLGLMTPLWWTLPEQPVRHLTWYCFNGVASIIGDLVSYGLGHATHSRVPTWELIFIVFGSFTSLWGVYLLLFLPDSPPSARFLSPEQKIIAVKRVATNRTGTKNTSFKPEQVKEAFMDPKLYILFFASIAAQIPNGVVSNFSSIIISGFGFTQLQTTLLDIPSNVFQIVSLVLSGYFAGKFRNSRAIMMASPPSIPSHTIPIQLTSQTWGRLVAFWFTSFQSVGFSLSLVMISANVGGYTKRQTINVATFMGYCIGNIAGPHVLIGSEASIGYPTATKSMMVAYVVKTALHLILGGYMLYWNRRWDREARERRESLSPEERRRKAEEIGMTDATEWGESRSTSQTLMGTITSIPLLIRQQATRTSDTPCRRRTSGLRFQAFELDRLSRNIAGRVQGYRNVPSSSHDQMLSVNCCASKRQIRGLDPPGCYDELWRNGGRVEVTALESGGGPAIAFYSPYCVQDTSLASDGPPSKLPAASPTHSQDSEENTNNRDASISHSRGTPTYASHCLQRTNRGRTMRRMSYGRSQWGVGKCLRTVVLVGVVLGGIEAGLIFALRKAHDRSLTWPFTLMAVLSATLLALGVGRHYLDIYQTRTIRGISFIFVGIDALGDLTSLLSLVFREKFDVLGAVIYGTELVMWIGIMICGVVLRGNEAPPPSSDQIPSDDLPLDNLGLAQSRPSPELRSGPVSVRSNGSRATSLRSRSSRTSVFYTTSLRAEVESL